jgi:putative hemolysin
MLYLELTIVLVLIVINGLLAMSELAIVSSRPARLRAMVERDVYGSRMALALASNPGRFLSTVQIGITLVGVLSGAFSGATLGTRLAQVFTDLGAPKSIAETAGVGIVVALITYASLIVGELVPKQIALRNPERVAVRVAPAMTWVARIAKPVVFLLDWSGRMVLRLFRDNTDDSGRVTDEEIRTIIAEAESAGVIETGERQMMTGVMRLADRTASDLMTPRADVDWVDLSKSDAEIKAALTGSQHSRLPAGDDLDTIIGVVQVRALLTAALAGQSIDVRSHVQTAPIMLDTADALDVLRALRDATVPMALLHDEYGLFKGVVTPADLMQVIAGVFRSDDEPGDPGAVQRPDKSWLIAGSLPADEMAMHLGIVLPKQRDYRTAAGFILAHMHRLPKTGETVEAHNWRFEVVDLDGRRIDKVLATRLATTRRERIR